MDDLGAPGRSGKQVSKQGNGLIDRLLGIVRDPGPAQEASATPGDAPNEIPQGKNAESLEISEIEKVNLEHDGHSADSCNLSCSDGFCDPDGDSALLGSCSCGSCGSCGCGGGGSCDSEYWY